MKNLKCYMLMLLLAGSLIVYAAAPQLGSWTDSTPIKTPTFGLVQLNWRADSTGTISSHTTPTSIRGILLQVITDPDTSLTPADSTGRTPSDNYDITLKNTNSVDVMGGALSNRDSTVTEIAVPLAITAYSDTTVYPVMVDGKLTVAITNNTKPNARGSISIYWLPK
jgi:hypothetical protein